MGRAVGTLGYHARNVTNDTLILFVKYCGIAVEADQESTLRSHFIACDSKPSFGAMVSRLVRRTC